MLKIEEVDELKSSVLPEDTNFLHSSIVSFYDQLAKFKKDHPSAPASSHIRFSQKQSIDLYFNEKMIKSIGVNASKSRVLQEIAICGCNFSLGSVQKLNAGILKCPQLKRLRLNFCLNRQELLSELTPALTSPAKVQLEVIDLSCNGLTDNDAAEVAAKIIVTHGEFRDEIFWKYGLRNELPPPSQIQGVKKIDLSFNKLSEKTAYHLGRVLQADRYVHAVSLRANLVDNLAADALVKNLNENTTLFNLDLRDN